MSVSLNFPPNTNPCDAIKLIEDRCAEKIIQSDTLMMKIQLLSKYAKMIYKMFCDPLYFAEKDFGTSRKEKFDRLSSLCEIDCDQTILQQLKTDIQDLEECHTLALNPQNLKIERAMLLQLKQIMTKIDDLDDNLSYNLALNIANFCNLDTHFTIKDLIFSNHILKIMKEQNTPQNK